MSEPQTPAGADPPPSATGVDALPDDELVRYGKKLGLKLTRETPRAESLRRVRDRQTLLGRLDREALLDIAKWARVPVRASSGKELLAAEIADIQKVDYESLSDRGLRALALLRDLPAESNEPRESVARRLRKAETVADWITRKRRGVTAKLVAKLLDAPAESSEDAAYQFLPEDGSAKSSTLREEIEGRGLVGSLANRLRGAADDYVRVKLDEIEQRIDRKLDEIDRRLGEWRDREVANRLRIIRITLLASVLVAGLSLAYKYVSRQVAEPAPSVPAQQTPRGP